MKIKFLDGTEKEFTSLQSADLQSADLRDANLRGADLQSADLRGADLQSADLRGANLRGADLQSADLRGADLRGANLRDANLLGANLRDANLRGANLQSANLTEAILPHFQICPEVGSFRAFKQVLVAPGCKHVIEIEIARTAQRTSSLIGRKCRASKIRVLPGQLVGCSPTHTPPITYLPGAVIEIQDFDPDIRVECTRGIHFFMTRREAAEY